jgi:SET domain-containing protein
MKPATTRTKNKVLQHLRNDIYCRLGVSSVHGIGVFAIRHIAKGEDPFRCLLPRSYIRLNKEDIEDLPQMVQRQIKRFCYCENRYIEIPASGLNVLDYAVYVNHSKSPNVSLTRSGHYKTQRPIRKGEELFLDYDDAFGEVHVFQAPAAVRRR